MASRHAIQIIQGGLYGSEAKGAIAAHLVHRDEIDYAVRTGATNAGHTVVYTDDAGVRHTVAMQQLPVGWVRPETSLVLGAGALIDIDILLRECSEITALTGRDVRNRLFIDYRAHIHRHEHKDRSTASDRHRLIGATGKGCSEALIDRIRLRGVEDWSFSKFTETAEIVAHWLDLGAFYVVDTEQMLNSAWDQGAKIQLEGTQGQMLDLYLGPYPYTTHKQTGPAQWMLECGLSPALPTDIVMIIRACPIRVAGNSGPLPEETSWPALARTINTRRHNHGLDSIVSESAIVAFEDAVRRASHAYLMPAGSDGLDQHTWSAEDRLHYRVTLSDLHKGALGSLDEATRAELGDLFEMTTVTRKLRRIALPHMPTLATAARQIRPHQVAMTFMNYLYPERWFTNDALTEPERVWLSTIEDICRAPVTLINRGPAPEHIIETGR